MTINEYIPPRLRPLTNTVMIQHAVSNTTKNEINAPLAPVIAAVRIWKNPNPVKKYRDNFDREDNPYPIIALAATEIAGPRNVLVKLKERPPMSKLAS